MPSKCRFAGGQQRALPGAKPAPPGLRGATLQVGVPGWNTGLSEVSSRVVPQEGPVNDVKTKVCSEAGMTEGAGQPERCWQEGAQPTVLLRTRLAAGKGPDWSLGKSIL